MNPTTILTAETTRELQVQKALLSYPDYVQEIISRREKSDDLTTVDKEKSIMYSDISLQYYVDEVYPVRARVEYIKLLNRVNNLASFNAVKQYIHSFESDTGLPLESLTLYTGSNAILNDNAKLYLNSLLEERQNGVVNNG